MANILHTVNIFLTPLKIFTSNEIHRHLLTAYLLCLQVSGLKAGHSYQFRVFAANAAGIGKPSDASEAFLCEKWTMPEPGGGQSFIKSRKEMLLTKYLLT